MKKLFLALLVLLSLNTYAQNLQIGFTGGTSISNYRSTVDGNTESAKAKAGFTAGILIDIPAGRHFSFQPAINFTQKGAKEDYDLMGTSGTSKLNINYLELPLNFLYNSRGRSGNFFIGAGPSFAYALGGKAKYESGTVSLSEKINFGSGDDDLMKSVDIGINVLAGYAARSGLMFSVNANQGLNNLFPHGSDDGTLKSFYVGIKLGYMLACRKKK